MNPDMNPAIKKLIDDKMKWDGRAPEQRGPYRYKEWKEYARNLDQWARAVRRDILVIEYHLKQRGVKESDLYGDPGDPPPPPE